MHWVNAGQHGNSDSQPPPTFNGPFRLPRNGVDQTTVLKGLGGGGGMSGEISGTAFTGTFR